MFHSSQVVQEFFQQYHDCLVFGMATHQLVISLSRTDSNHDFSVPIRAVFHGICHLVQVCSFLQYLLHIFLPLGIFESMISNFWWGQQGTVCRVFKAPGITSSPTNPDPSKVAIVEAPGPCNYRFKPLHMEGLMIVGVGQLLSRWWFQIFFIFTPIWGRFPF